MLCRLIWFSYFCSRNLSIPSTGFVDFSQLFSLSCSLLPSFYLSSNPQVYLSPRNALQHFRSAQSFNRRCKKCFGNRKLFPSSECVIKSCRIFKFWYVKTLFCKKVSALRRGVGCFNCTPVGFPAGYAVSSSFQCKWQSQRTRFFMFWELAQKRT